MAGEKHIIQVANFNDYNSSTCYYCTLCYSENEGLHSWMRLRDPLISHQYPDIGEPNYKWAPMTKHQPLVIKGLHVKKTYNPLNLSRKKEMQMGERNHLDGENKIKSVYSVGCLLLEVLALKTDRLINQSFASPCHLLLMETFQFILSFLL